MPHVDNAGINIHYEVAGAGTPLVLQHGQTGRLRDWHQAGYVEALRRDYRLILIDARGHGASDKPHAPEAYSLRSMAHDVVTVLDDLGLDKAHYFGASMGGRIGWGIAKYAPERFRSLIVEGAPPPLARDPAQPNAFLALYQQGMEVLLAKVKEVYGPRWTPAVEADMRANDLQALIALVSTEDYYGLPGFEDVLPTITMPCLLVMGADDWHYAGARQSVERMPNAKLVTLSGTDHIDAFYRSDLVLPHVSRFLAGVDRAG